MKLLTSTFLTCAVKSCRSSPLSYPLHFRDATLLRSEIEYNPLLLRNLLPRLNLDALESTVGELGLGGMMPAKARLEEMIEGRPNSSGSGVSNAQQEEDDEKAKQGPPDADMVGDGAEDSKRTVTREDEDEEEGVMKKLHALLIETSVQEGKLVCGNCGFEYPIKEGVGNFLLPGHLV